MLQRVQKRFACLIVGVLMAGCATQPAGPDARRASGALQPAETKVTDSARLDSIYCLNVAGSAAQHYITGSNHVPLFFKVEVSDQVKALVEKSDVLLLEATLPPIREELIDNRRLHRSIGQLVPPLTAKVAEQIDAQFRKDPRLQREKWQRLSPIVVFQVLEGLVGFPPPQGVSLDAQFVRAARRGKSQIDGIELIREQILVFNQVATHDWEKTFQSLMTYIGNETQRSQFLDALRLQYAAFGSANWDDFDARVRAHGNYMSMSVPLMADGRNPRIADRIVSRLKADQRSHFIALGAAHMGGPKGVLNLLQARGASLQKNCEAAGLSN